MKALFTLFFFVSIILSVNGQEKKDLTISVSKGYLTSGYYHKSNGDGYVGIDFEYNLTQKHILTVGYLSGKHYYSEKEGSDAILYSGGGNAKVNYHIFSVLYKYRVFEKGKLKVLTGVGAGVMTKTREFYYKGDTEPKAARWSKAYFAIPVSLDVNYKMSRNWFLGIKGGLTVEPGASLTSALYAGPRLSFLLP